MWLREGFIPLGGRYLFPLIGFYMLRVRCASLPIGPARSERDRPTYN